MRAPRCGACWQPFGTIFALERHKALCSISTPESDRSFAGNPDRDGVDHQPESEPLSPATPAGLVPLVPFLPVGEGHGCAYCHRHLPDLIAIITAEGELGFCSQAHAATWVRENWIESRSQAVG